MPTSIEVLNPSAARTTIITITTAVKTFPSVSEIISRAQSALSLE